jgi:hypothetical protein
MSGKQIAKRVEAAFARDRSRDRRLFRTFGRCIVIDFLRGATERVMAADAERICTVIVLSKR